MGGKSNFLRKQDFEKPEEKTVCGRERHTWWRKVKGPKQTIMCCHCPVKRYVFFRGTWGGDGIFCSSLLTLGGFIRGEWGEGGFRVHSTCFSYAKLGGKTQTETAGKNFYLLDLIRGGPSSFLPQTPPS